MKKETFYRAFDWLQRYDRLVWIASSIIGLIIGRWIADALHL